MDLQLLFRVLWRFRVLVALGLLLGIFFAFLAMVRVSPTSAPHFSYRTQPQYESDTQVFVTTKDFPWGSINLSNNGAVDVDVLRSLAVLYQQLAVGNDVRAILLRGGPIDGKLATFPVLAPDSSTMPLVGLTASATSAPGARSLAVRHLRALQTWLRLKQNHDGTLAKNRIVLQPILGPTPGKLLVGRKLTKPLLILMAMLVATIGLAFALENMRPRVRPVAESEDEEPPYDQQQRLSA